jgi:Transcription elongation factor, GreA/GreB, C-term
VGCRVQVRHEHRDEDGDEVESFVIAAPGEGDLRAGRISCDSPLGQALLRRRVGDVVEALTPVGPRRLIVLHVDESERQARRWLLMIEQPRQRSPLESSDDDERLDQRQNSGGPEKLLPVARGVFCVPHGCFRCWRSSRSGSRPASTWSTLASKGSSASSGVKSARARLV